MPKSIFQFCGTCGFYQPQNLSCPLMPHMNGRMTANDYCSKYTDQLITCERCHNILLKPNVITFDENEYHTYCDACLASLQ